jgi:hypothetical protein
VFKRNGDHRTLVQEVWGGEMIYDYANLDGKKVKRIMAINLKKMEAYRQHQEEIETNYYNRR